MMMLRTMFSTMLGSMAVALLAWETTSAQTAFQISDAGVSPLYTQSEMDFATQQAGFGLRSDVGCNSCDDGSCDGGCDTGSCDSSSCDSGYGCDSGGYGDCGCVPWKICPTKHWGIDVRGHLSMGYTYNAASPTSGYNGPLSFNDRDDFQGNQAWLTVERTLDNCSGFGVGGRFDILYGSDYIFTQATGLETRRDGSPHWNQSENYGLALPQAYLEVGNQNISAKVGRFFTPIGYESVSAKGNFFYSHAYTMLYAEPFTHTGVLASANHGSFELLAGAVNGWDRFEGQTNRTSILGGANWESCDGRTSIAFSGIIGQEQQAQNGNSFQNRWMYSAVLRHQMGCRWEYVLQHDNLYQENYTGNINAEAYGVNQYLFYTINDRLKLGVRGEWFRDDDGIFVGGNRSANNPSNGRGFAGNFYEVTAGLNWSPFCNLTVRPEVRWDRFSGNANPFDDGNSQEQYTAAIDFVLTY